MHAVYYPGLEQHPDHAIAAKQMRGFGGMVCVDVGGGYDRAAARFFDRLKVFKRAASLGGVESLCSLPVLTSQWGHTEEDRAAGVTEAWPGCGGTRIRRSDLDQAWGAMICCAAGPRCTGSLPKNRKRAEA